MFVEYFYSTYFNTKVIWPMICKCLANVWVIRQPWLKQFETNSRVFTRTLRETNVHIILERDEHLVIGHIVHMILYLQYL